MSETLASTPILTARPPSPPKAAGKTRIRSIDVLKGTLIAKMVFHHAALYAGSTELAHIFGFLGRFTFGALLFCFAVGTGLSARRRPWWPLLVLLGCYVVGAGVLAGSTIRSGEPLPLLLEYETEMLRMAALGYVADVVLFRQPVPYLEFLPAYILCIGLTTLHQRMGWSARVSRAGFMLVVGAALYLLAQYGIHYESGTLSILWSSNWAAAKSVLLFGLGLVLTQPLVRLLQRPPSAVLAVVVLVILVGLKKVMMRTDLLSWTFHTDMAVTFLMLAPAFTIACLSLLETLIARVPDFQGVALLERLGRASVWILAAKSLFLPAAILMRPHWDGSWAAAGSLGAGFVVLMVGIWVGKTLSSGAPKKERID
jgi:hypothetical protein